MSHVSTNPPWRDYPSRETLISAHALENIENALDDAVLLNQQAQAAALEIPDANVSALIGNPATDTRQVLDDLLSPLTTNASTTAPGIVELATAAETAMGTDTDRAVTPSGVKPLLDAKANVTLLNAKADAADVYTKGQTYTKSEVDAKVGTAEATNILVQPGASDETAFPAGVDVIFT